MRVSGSLKSSPGKNTFHKRRLLAVAAAFTLLILSLSGCIGTDPQDTVEDSAVTKSPENVSRVFAESVFCGDYEKMLACFPPEYSGSLAQEDIDLYVSWAEETKAALEKSGTEYLGTSSGNSELISGDKTPADYRDSAASISLAFGIPSTSIEEIRTCGVRVFCNIDKSKHYQDVTILVFKYNSNWYASISLQNDAVETSAG